jgi:hypothetical protein
MAEPYCRLDRTCSPEGYRITPYTYFAEYGLIEYEEGMRTYRTTEKGMRLLQIQNTMDEIAPDYLHQREIKLK